MDPYVYPGTSVLKNLRDIRDASLLDEFEADATGRRLRSLGNRPIHGRFDTRHLQTIHRTFSRTSFAWAGDFRTVNISKPGGSFAFHEYIAPNLDRVCPELKNERFLAGTELDQFANRAGYYLGEINAIHPFREGNGRAQREFIRELAVQNGFAIDRRRISHEQMIDASRRSPRVHSAGLRELLRRAIDKQP